MPDSVRAPLKELHCAVLAAGGATDGSGYLQEATEQLSRLIGARRCSLLILRDGCLFHGGSIGLEQRFLDGIEGLEAVRGHGTCGTAAATGEPVVTEDIVLDVRWNGFRELAEESGLRACWSVPLALPGGETLGTFATYSTEPYKPSAVLVELIAAHASLVALGLDRMRQEERLAESYEAVVVALSTALDVRDEYTGAHSAATAEFAVRVGERLGLDEAELEELNRVAVLHDIGKLGIPTEILGAPRPLTAHERELVERHPVIGEQMLRRIPQMRSIALAVRHEHEWWDGTGYPDGLQERDIPLASRIVLVCDAWHAMTSDRPYRRALDQASARNELIEGSGTQFDPDVVRELLALLDEAPDSRPLVAVSGGRFTPHSAG